MCLEQERHPSVDLRKRIHSDIQRLLRMAQFTFTVLAQIDNARQQLEDTYHNDKYHVTLAMPLTIIADEYFHGKEHKKAVLCSRNALTYCTSISPVSLARIVWYAKIMFLAYNSLNDSYILPARTAMLDLVRVYAGAQADVFFEIWVPALGGMDAKAIFDLITRRLPVDKEADFKANRELRRRGWTKIRSQHPTS
jgi:hypothetical protein